MFSITISIDFKHLFCKDKQLLGANAYFVWNCYSKEIRKEKGTIEKGTVEIHKNDDNSLSITLDVDTGFKFGGFFSKRSSNRIKAKESRLKIEL